MVVNDKYCRAFTLVEMLMATAMAVVVGMVVYKTLAGGISIWKWSNEYRVRGDVTIFFNKASGDLDNNCSFSNYTFRGDQNGMTLFVHDPDYMTMSAKDIAASGKKDGMPVYKVEYKYLPDNGQVKRMTYRLGSAKSETETIAISGLSSCVFEYYIRDGETKAMTKTGSISERSPDGVAISLKLKNGKDEDEIFKRNFEIQTVV